ncbi:hypothetical protein BHE74_00033880, partial [Ensete ventricosum]
GIYLPCYDIFRNWIEEFTACNAPTLTPYAPLFAGSFARSLACVACSPIELARTRMQYEDTRDTTMLEVIDLIKILHYALWFSLRSGKAPYWAIRTGPPADRYVDRALPGRTAEIGHSLYFLQTVQGYRILWTGVGAQLARDVPFSAICWSTLESVTFFLHHKLMLHFLVLGANFSAGFVAGSIAAAATCPLDVAKTRRQIEKDPSRALNMTTRQTLVEVW